MVFNDPLRQFEALSRDETPPIGSRWTIDDKPGLAVIAPPRSTRPGVLKRTRRDKTGRDVLVLCASMALAAVAGCHNSQQEPAKPNPIPAKVQVAAPTRQEPGQASLDPSAVRSGLVILSAGKNNDMRTIVVLGRPACVGDIPDFKQPSRPDMLPREIVRQAALLAARDELGLATRDEVIDETPADRKDGVGTIEVVSFIRDNRSRELIQRVQKDQSETLISHETPTTPGRNLDLKKLLASAEVLSRDEFPKVLKGLGLTGQRNAVKEEAELPEKAEDRLTSLDFTDVLLAVRDLHRAMRNDGESPSRLGALARGYALLGVLAEFQWHPAHRALKGRGLLYAQRLVARQPDAPSGLWNRAFALALVGRHGDALADLDEAKKKADAQGSAAPPDWLEPVDAFAHCDSARLKSVGGRQAKFAALLRMLALAYPRSTAAGLRSANDVVLLEPYCFRAHDAMADFFGVSTQHATNTIGPQALEHFVSKRLTAGGDLPAILKTDLAAKPTLVHAAGLLDKAGAVEIDTGEPSWRVLGHFLRETRFVHVYRRLYFTRFMLGVPVDQMRNEGTDDVAGHRYRPYLESLVLPQREAGETLRKLADEIDLVDIEPTESAMTTALYNTGRPKGQVAWQIARAHEDETTEMAMSLWQSKEQNQLEVAQEILKVSPYHPYARAVVIKHAWDLVKDQVPAWEKESADSPAVLAALGVHYSAAKNYDDAQRVLSRYIELSPDVWAFQTLAANFKAQGKIDRWQETLDTFLNTVEDLGLDHAKVRVEIANHYMGMKQWDKARPYAEAAAATWAEWAMECAARCAEGEQAWERAEAWYSRATERYPDNSWAVWYLFCKRTRHGNAEAARDFAERHVSARADRPESLNPEYAGCFYWLDGRQKQASDAFAKAYERNASVSAALCQAMIADDEKDQNHRDAILKELTTSHAAKAPKSIAICQMLLDTIFNAGGKKPLDIAAVDGLIESMAENGRGNACFFVGWFLKNAGDADNARKYLERCSQSPRSLFWYRYLADEAAARLGGAKVLR